MRYRTRHTTTYLYGEPVSLCHNDVRMTPRSGMDQVLLEHNLTIDPPPQEIVSRIDYFGNTVSFFSIDEPHTRLEIVAESLVEIFPQVPPMPELTPAWEDARSQTREELSACQYVFDSSRIRASEEFRKYADPSFPPGANLFEGVFDLCRRIHEEFRYLPESTQVDTPVETSLQLRRGVCQDFAHVAIACLRSLGVAARYVSGYLRSGKDRVGADATHAWVSVYFPGFDWIDFDPTNNCLGRRGNHVTVAWGRDYSDVSPMKGVMVGGGEHLVRVAVGVVAE